jgi:hypothetical protein
MSNKVQISEYLSSSSSSEGEERIQPRQRKPVNRFHPGMISSDEGSSEDVLQSDLSGQEDDDDNASNDSLIDDTPLDEEQEQGNESEEEESGEEEEEEEKQQFLFSIDILKKHIGSYLNLCDYGSPDVAHVKGTDKLLIVLPKETNGEDDSTEFAIGFAESPMIKTGLLNPMVIFPHRTDPREDYPQRVYLATKEEWNWMLKESKDDPIYALKSIKDNTPLKIIRLGSLMDMKNCWIYPPNESTTHHRSLYNYPEIETTKVNSRDRFRSLAITQLKNPTVKETPIRRESGSNNIVSISATATPTNTSAPQSSYLDQFPGLGSGPNDFLAKKSDHQSSSATRISSVNKPTISTTSVNKSASTNSKKRTSIVDSLCRKQPAKKKHAAQNQSTSKDPVPLLVVHHSLPISIPPVENTLLLPPPVMIPTGLPLPDLIPCKDRDNNLIHCTISQVVSYSQIHVSKRDLTECNRILCLFLHRILIAGCPFDDQFYDEKTGEIYFNHNEDLNIKTLPFFYAMVLSCLKRGFFYSQTTIHQRIIQEVRLNYVGYHDRNEITTDDHRKVLLLMDFIRKNWLAAEINLDNHSIFL